VDVSPEMGSFSHLRGVFRVIFGEVAAGIIYESSNFFGVKVSAAVKLPVKTTTIFFPGMTKIRWPLYPRAT
jgi:hypothetical protein